MDNKTSKILNRRLLSNFTSKISDFADTPMPLKAEIFFDEAHFEQEKTSFYFNALNLLLFQLKFPLQTAISHWKF